MLESADSMTDTLLGRLSWLILRKGLERRENNKNQINSKEEIINQTEKKIEKNGSVREKEWERKWVGETKELIGKGRRKKKMERILKVLEKETKTNASIGNEARQ